MLDQQRPGALARFGDETATEFDVFVKCRLKISFDDPGQAGRKSGTFRIEGRQSTRRYSDAEVFVRGDIEEAGIDKE